MPQVCEWAAFHHERLDGNGYPFHHQGKDLTLGARIMAVADVFTALTEDRPYRKGMERQKVISILEKHARGGGVDGDIVTVLRSDYEVINEIRREEQRSYKAKQEHLINILDAPQEAAA